MSDFLFSLLSYYQISLKQLEIRKKQKDYKDLKTPYNLPDFLNVVNRIIRAQREKEKVVIYGDYDFDGLSSTAIMKRCLDYLNVKSGFYIPSRYKEGYGLNKSRIDDFKKKDYNLIIAVDNGISLKEEIEYANSMNMDVIVIDHHLSSSRIEGNFFHQIYSDFLSYNCSAASLAFFISSYIRGEFDDYDALLAGLAVFSDVMPLVGNNLVLANIAKENINSDCGRNLKLLFSSSYYEFDSLSFNIIPVINSVGRVKEDVISNNNACRFLIDDSDSEKNKKYASFLLSCNEKKKEMIRNFQVIDELENEYVDVIISSSLTGLNGLYANQLCSKKDKCTAVFSKKEDDDSLFVGSLRAVNPISLEDFIYNPKKYFISSGGHKNAMGLTIEKKDFFQFASDYSLLVSRFEREEKKCIEITLDDLTLKNLDILKDFEPFSEGFPRPLFKVSVLGKDIKKYSEKYSLAMSLNHEGKVSFFGDIKDIEGDEIYNFYGEGKEEFYSGRRYFVISSRSYII